VKRLLSDAVEVRPAVDPKVREAAILTGEPIRTALPTDSDVRDALAKLGASMRDMVLARKAGAEGWEVSDMETTMTETAEGQIILRGYVLMTRDEDEKPETAGVTTGG
jgi:hypothetical protein